MTPLTDKNGKAHPVTRLANLRGKHVAVTLNENGTITFRQHGKRTKFSTHLSGCLNLAIIEQAMSEYKKKAETYAAKKKLGIYKNLRRPKKPAVSTIFSSQYSFAIKH